MTRRLFCNIWEYSVIFCKTTKDSNVFNIPENTIFSGMLSYYFLEKHIYFSKKQNTKNRINLVENRQKLFLTSINKKEHVFQKNTPIFLENHRIALTIFLV